MRTTGEQGQPYSPTRLLEMLEFRFGAFEAIAYASVEMARKGARRTPMDRMTAEAILEFGDDLRQAYEAAGSWSASRRGGNLGDSETGAGRSGDSTEAEK